MIDINLSDMLSLDALNRAFDAAPSREKKLRPVHPNVAIEEKYRAKLFSLIDAMNRSILHWIKAEYRKNPPAIAQDELSAAALKRMLARLASQWTEKFDALAESLAKWHAQAIQTRSDAALKKMMKDAGWTVDFKMTEAQRDVFAASVNENVSLIKSIPIEHLSKVEGVVMRSVQAGFDMAMLATELQKRFGVTKKRAAFIARDQTKKTTAMLNRARYVELGITECEWVHSGGGKHPRQSHVKAGREKARFDPAMGWFDPDEKAWIQPGQLINCRCVSRPVIKGFS